MRGQKKKIENRTGQVISAISHVTRQTDKDGEATLCARARGRTRIRRRTSDSNEIYETCQRRLLARKTKGMLGKY